MTKKAYQMNLIDTHCHLNDPSFSDVLPDVIGRAKSAGVDRLGFEAINNEIAAARRARRRER